MSHIEEVRQTIVDHIAHLEDELASARLALDALDGSQKPAKRDRAAELAVSLPKRRNGKRGKAKVAKVVLAGTLTSILAKTDGLGTEALAKETGGEGKQIRVLLKELELGGQVRRTGQRRATRWHVITEADKVAERAKELANQSKAKTPAKRTRKPATRRPAAKPATTAPAETEQTTLAVVPDAEPAAA